MDSDSDIEGAKESQDRIIAGVASSVAAVRAPDVQGVVAPGDALVLVGLGVAEAGSLPSFTTNQSPEIWS